MSKIHKHYSSNKFIVLSIVIFAIALSYSAIYQTQQAEARKKTRERLQAEITNLITQYQNGEARLVDLSQISYFSWDKVYMFGPYLWIDAIQERLGYSWRPDDDKFGELETDRPFNYIVFTLDGKVVQYVEYPIGLADFSEAAERIEGYKPDEAIFVINEYGTVLWLYE
jgi:type II secretory pathway pseudopilin PulG